MTIVTPVSDPLSRALILAIFTSCGRCRFLDEKHFDACTAVAGSGPAFVALILEAMADGGVMMGLPRLEALELAAQSGSERDRADTSDTRYRSFGIIRQHAPSTIERFRHK